MTEQTIPHKLIALIQRKKEIELGRGARILNVDDKTLMQFARILSESKIVEIYYTVAGDVFLRQGRDFRRAVDDMASYQSFSLGAKSVDETKVKEETHYVDDFLVSVRKKIMEKRRDKPESQQ